VVQEGFPKLPVYLRTHYTKWQQNQRVRDAVAKAAPGEARLREINAGFGMTSAAATETRTVTVLMPPTMPQPQGTLMLQPVLGVVWWLEGLWLGEHHQLGEMILRNTGEERMLGLEKCVICAANIVYNMVEA
jgi:hypothetical protein